MCWAEFSLLKFEVKFRDGNSELKFNQFLFLGLWSDFNYHLRIALIIKFLFLFLLFWTYEQQASISQKLSFVFLFQKNWPLFLYFISTKFDLQPDPTKLQILSI